ncbi:GAF and ANTAR domain-containing protein [Lentzea sp. BCCO 10_0798]|uniref:GAF and ANTAR domain-containing protein n=1 Tax=Lentzea kristufekii TaxID=3095430 RepID=A0ABU4TWU0_9PSEU|nr:GAF and ANTAR domain-containing protein [Lentzea sp. BCCO 10_0798]MDX8052780.1 GAF and ANTAR domain-containing protein [Lentzea sp. BCCO 10_0798]
MRDSRVAEILSVIADSRDGRMTLPARLVAECLSALPVSGVAVALMTADGPSGVVLAATDEQARHGEELQFALGEGPCVEASRSGRPVLQPDVETAGSARWPQYGAAVLDAGVRAVFAFPLRVGAIRVGVLDLYRDTPGQLGSLEVADAQAFADAATVMVLHLQEHDGRDGTHSALGGPIDGQAEVHQATGMISVQLGVSLAEALLRLRAHAYAAGRTVSAVAADVVNRRMSFDDSESGTTMQQERQ